MRKIKFRGRGFAGEWHIGDLNDDSLIRQGYSSTFIENKTVGQFTGLYDKNGKEIYEGDILVWGENECKSQPMIVMFKHGSFGYTYIEDWFHSFADNTNFTFNPLNTDVRFEIVGNIHDNPELLKGGAE